jgi:hypothetical protein
VKCLARFGVGGAEEGKSFDCRAVKKQVGGVLVKSSPTTHYGTRDALRETVLRGGKTRTRTILWR